MCLFFLSSRRRHTRLQGDWSSDVCSSDLAVIVREFLRRVGGQRVLKVRGAAFVTRRVDPRTVRVNGVSRDADDGCADVEKVLVTIDEVRQVSRTDAREIEWMKHHNDRLLTIEE